MSTLLRRRPESWMSLPVYRRFELLTGRIMPVVTGYNSYATGSSRNLLDYVSDQMRAGWRNHRATLMAIWTGELDEEEAFHNTLPWLYLGPRSRPPWAGTHLDEAKQATR